tara:strand:- start:74 stop:1198 length:1125 start_codon:yes stop_codon:yes gene_type:complete
MINYLIIIFLSISFSQECDGGRYEEEIFNSIYVTSNVYYGTNVNDGFFGDVEQDLYLDVYEPVGDDLEDRPLIIMMFGGSFVGGSKSSSDIVELCTRYAKMGYVAAAIDYRLTTELIIFNNEETAYKAASKGIHDLKGAIRFFRMNDELYNDYRIDTDRIYAGGVSAGAISAVNAAYLDLDEEIPSFIEGFIEDNGGLEGNSGNPGYDSSFHGIINLCGAVGQTDWIIDNDIPIVNLHGTADDVVPYGEGLITLFNLNMQVAGSGAIHPRMIELGNNSSLLTWDGVGHTPFISSSSYMDETVAFSSQFIRDLACENQMGEMGDLNQDSTINVLDIVILVNLILSSEYVANADLNEDSTINVLDVVLLVNIVLGN